MLGELDPLMAVALFAGGILSGGLSAIAGGSSFLTFPLLLATGLSPLAANITNFIALTPSNMVALAAYREELRELKSELPVHLVLAVAGGTLGSLLLLWSGEARFEHVMPWLLLFATVLFALGGWLRQVLQTLARRYPKRGRVGFYVFEFALMVYGGYFGAGLGIVLLACLIIVGSGSIHQANAVKNAVIAMMSVVSFAIYTASGHVAWPAALIMMSGVFIGGYASIRFLKRVPDGAVRMGVLAWAIVLTIAAFWKYG